jgi:hypothetical protein
VLLVQMRLLVSRSGAQHALSAVRRPLKHAATVTFAVDVVYDACLDPYGDERVSLGRSADDPNCGAE